MINIAFGQGGFIESFKQLLINKIFIYLNAVI